MIALVAALAALGMVVVSVAAWPLRAGRYALVLAGAVLLAVGGVLAGSQ